MNQVKLMKGYQEFLDSFVWDIYITVTFRHVTSAVAALRAFRHFFFDWDEVVEFFKISHN